MIPSASMVCLVTWQDGRCDEASIRDVSALGFTLRLPRLWAEKAPERFTVRVHGFSGDEECVLEAENCDISTEEIQPDFVIRRVETVSAAYRELMRRWMAAYQQYVALKQMGDDAALSEALTGYPAEQEGVFPASFAAQREAWFSQLVPDAAWIEWMKRQRWAAALSAPALWMQYLRMPMAAFSAWYWQTGGLCGHPLHTRRFECVVIGSQFCPLLCPDAELLQALLDKAWQEGVRPVLALSTMAEGKLNSVLAMLDALRLKEPLELIVNDWGLMALLAQDQRYMLTLGVLLQKRRKDVRMDYMQGFGGKAALLRENAVNADFYRQFLADQGVRRISCEACGYEQTLPEGPVSLHLPFYQMNTAGHCTLYASCHEGSRGLQRAVTECGCVCGTRAFLYPDMLRMVGRFNTLFGYDRRSLEDGAYMQSMMTAGIDRMVIDLL